MPRIRNIKACVAMLAGLGLSACTGIGGQEPLYALVDGMGRPVALAGRSQLGNVAPGTPVRANIGGVERELMVAERVGMGAMMAPVQQQPAMAEAPLPPAVTRTEAESVEPALRTRTRQRSSTRAGSSQTAATRAGSNPPGRNRLPPARSVSRSVM